MKRVLLLLLGVLLLAEHRAFCDEAGDCFNRGNENFLRGDTNGALAEFNRAIELDSKYVKAYPNRAFLKQARGDFEGAIADYTRAIELKPDYVLAYGHRGNTKQAIGDLDGAVVDYNKAIELKPDDPFAYYNRGNVRRIRGDLSGALADFNKAIEANPGMPKRSPVAGSSNEQTEIWTGRWRISPQPSESTPATRTLMLAEATRKERGETWTAL